MLILCLICNEAVMPLKTWDANCSPLSEIVMLGRLSYVRILDVRLAFRLRLSVCCKAEHNNYSLCKSLIDHDKKLNQAVA